MTKRSMPCLFHATLYALGAARLRMLNLLRSVDPLPIRGRVFLVGYSCLNLKHFVRSKRIYGEGLSKKHQHHREVIMEEQAFRQAVEDHRDVVFRIALTYLRDRADADDVAQDVFLKLLKNDAQFESWEHLRRWLIRVTINECKSLFRKPWRRVEDIENLADRFRRRRMRPRRSCQTLCDFRSDSVLPSCSITIWAFRPQRLPSYCMYQPRPFERV